MSLGYDGNGSGADMSYTIDIGTTHTFEKITEPHESAASVASGAMDVFSTPSLVALFEQTALQAVDPRLPEGMGTVGVEVHVKHLKATPIGAKVRCTVEVTAIEGKRVSFSGIMWDDNGQIGEGMHTRYIIDKANFLKRLG